MVVDFRFGKAKAASVVSVRWKGAWSDARIRKEFEGLARWASERRLRTGRWFFVEPSERTWEVAIEVRGKVRGAGRVHLRRWPASDVAEVQFDPDEVSPRVVYHGLSDWLRWRRKDKTIARAGQYREVYTANPWKNPAAWHAMTVQVVVRKR